MLFLETTPYELLPTSSLKYREWNVGTPELHLQRRMLYRSDRFKHRLVSHLQGIGLATKLVRRQGIAVGVGDLLWWSWPLSGSCAPHSASVEIVRATRCEKWKGGSLRINVAGVEESRHHAEWGVGGVPGHQRSPHDCSFPSTNLGRWMDALKGARVAKYTLARD